MMPLQPIRESSPAVSPLASKAIASLCEEHERIGHQLSLLEEEFARVGRGADPDVDRMRDVLERVTDYVDRFHDPREQIALRHLYRSMASEPSIEAELLRERARIADTCERLRGELALALTDVPILRGALDRDGIAYATALRRLMHVEESQLYPLAERTLSDEDWIEVVGTLEHGAM